MGSRFATHVLEVPALDDGDAQSAHGLVDIAALAAEQLTLQRTQLLRRLYDRNIKRAGQDSRMKQNGRGVFGG